MSTDNTSSAKVMEKKEEAVTILLIAHKQNQFSSAASFLTRRGLQCTLRGNIKDGIQFITKNKPTFVFLSWNLPNAHIVKTYQLFTQKFGVKCIVFAETTDGKTAAELANSRIPETMQAPVSGPGLYMRIQKLMKSKDDADSPEIRQTREGYKKEEDKQNFIRMSSGAKKDDKPGVINFQKPKDSEEDIEGTNFLSSSSSGSDNDISDLLKDLTNDPDFAIEQTNVNVQSYNVEEGKEDSKSTDQTSGEQKKKKPVDYGTVTNIAKKKIEPIGITVNTNDNGTPKAHHPHFVPVYENKVQQSLLFQQTLQALNDTLRQVEVGYEKVQKVSKARILNIQSQRFHGYLIIVVPMFHELDRGLFSAIKEKIQSLLKEQGEELYHFESLNVDLEQVDFLPWCQDHAEFYIQTADKKNEIICAYFPMTPSMPKMEEQDKMASINTSDLKPNTKSNFNLFIHLPKNNKFLRYLKTGDVITENHTKKFEQNNLKNLHIKKEEVGNFKEYFASQQLNQIIRKKS